MIRITDSMGVTSAKYDLAKAQLRLAQKQREASSGEKIQRASDDAVAASSLARVDADLAANKQYEENIERSIGALHASDGALSNIGDLILEIKEIAVAMGNSTYNQEDRDEAAEQILGIREQIYALMNERHGDRYVFSGYLDDAVPFTTTGTYVGDTNRKKIQPGDGLEFEVGVTGADVMTPAGGKDVWATIDKLATAMKNGDYPGIADGIVDMVDIHDQVVESRSEIGRQMGRLENQENFLVDRDVQLTQERSRLADADTVETLSEMVQAQESLNATLQVTAQVLQNLSLVNYL